MATSPSYAPIGNRLLKVMVILLCSINALMWKYYTESTFMAIVWVAIAIAFVAWIIDDMRR
jgi:membrane protein YdbS with pleckstrin-like domain